MLLIAAPFISITLIRFLRSLPCCRSSVRGVLKLRLREIKSPSRQHFVPKRPRIFLPSCTSESSTSTLPQPSFPTLNDSLNLLIEMLEAFESASFSDPHWTAPVTRDAALCTQLNIPENTDTVPTPTLLQPQLAPLSYHHPSYSQRV
ncbi:hypothetical protein B0H13DRAFT_2354082 [Mycena leptocephala]|nr:hypothetical protein B0H13DRAFT_2354082 [Mycena leptocephala]